MADISKCCNTKCPFREDCFRYRVKPNEFRQAYNNFDRDKQDCFSSLEGWDERCLIPKGALVKNIFEGLGGEDEST